MERLLRAALSQLVTKGTLRVALPGGRSFTSATARASPSRSDSPMPRRCSAS